MSIRITGKNIELTQAITEYIEKKLERVSNHFDTIIAIDVEIDKNKHHKKGDVYHVGMNMQIPEHVLHAEEMAADMYAAIDVCSDEIQRQVQKQKEKWQAKRREDQKAKRALKEAQ